MAHDSAKKVAVRSDYIRGLTLEVAARNNDVPIGTARNWKREAAASGDDWDKLRSAQLLAGGGIEEVTRRVLAATISQTEATLEKLNADTEIVLANRVQMLVSLGDSLTKMVAASRKMMPETDALAVKLDTIKGFGEFVLERFPASAPALLEALEAYREVAARG